ncbi:suppressor of fused domain protein [Actinoplanes sp. NEAU-A12]|uniref:Suppressor of fused domain protein n=1 Tax=Actinoplanes sandaracinus TaxID=3045177 RepID=A0ABT6WVK5_9ACTN|nr:suppressor of fused domain protein [Actinoplanes sandaracinus]MDI6103781.1 suppressor of fused domain protein [Actinoplanes sandaracinus]
MMWDAITEAMAGLYPRAQPWHVTYPAEGFDLRAASAYPADGHWHFVTYGLGERWGFELTFRVVRGAGEQPPQWPFLMLNRVAGYANAAAEPFEEGQWLDLGGPVTGFPGTDGPATGLTVVILAADPQLGDRFLQLVGVTAAEANGEVEIDDDHPLLVTDPGRA